MYRGILEYNKTKESLMVKVLRKLIKWTYVPWYFRIQ